MNLKYVASSICNIFISYRNIINRDDLRCNYICLLVLWQTLADCDAVASSGCQGVKTENGKLREEWKYEFLCTIRNFEKWLLAVPFMSVCPYFRKKQHGHQWKNLLDLLKWDDVFKPSRKFKFGKNRTNRWSTVTKHLK